MAELSLAVPMRSFGGGMLLSSEDNVKNIKFVGLGLAVFFVLATIWIYINRGVQAKWDEQYQQTLAAYRRASEMNISSENVYEPRLLEFEKDLDALAAMPLPHEDFKGRRSRLLKTQGLETCKAKMNEYRDAFSSGDVQSLSAIGSAVSNCERSGRSTIH